MRSLGQHLSRWVALTIAVDEALLQVHKNPDNLDSDVPLTQNESGFLSKASVSSVDVPLE
jgi:hypothetical protein